MIHEVEIPDELVPLSNEFVQAKIQPQFVQQIVISALLDFGDYWLVGYDTKAALEGDVSQSLAGNRPFRVQTSENGMEVKEFEDVAANPLREILLTATGTIDEIVTYDSTK